MLDYITIVAQATIFGPGTAFPSIAFGFLTTYFPLHFYQSICPSAHVGICHLVDRGDGPDAVGLEGRVLDDLRARVSAGRHLPPLKLDVRPHAPPVQFLHRADVVGEGRLWLLQVSSGVCVEEDF